MAGVAAFSCFVVFLAAALFGAVFLGALKAVFLGAWGAALVGALLAGCLAGGVLADFFAAFAAVLAAFLGVESFLAMVDRAAGSSRDASQQEKQK